MNADGTGSANRPSASRTLTPLEREQDVPAGPARQLRQRRADDLAVTVVGEQVRVVIVQMPPIYRYGLSALLRAAGMQCSTTSFGEELRGALEGPGRTVVVVEAGAAAHLPQARGASRDDLFLVHVVPEVTAASCADALRSGATGVVAVDAEPHHAVDVIRAAATGSSLLRAEIARSLCRPTTAPAPQVSVRERSWLRRLGDGATVAGLARSEGYSEREMYRRLSGLYHRLGAGNRTGALVLAERWGLLTRDEG